MTTLKEYYTTYNEFLKGNITEAEWLKFSQNVTTEVIHENKELLRNFQNEWAK